MLIRTIRAALTSVVLLSLLIESPAVAAAQANDGNAREGSSPSDTVVYRLNPITVTATRTPREVFATPSPVSIVDDLTLRRAAPNSVVDLFTRLPGLDVTGVGPTQTRPAIRGQRGQRILLLADGLRLNNARRQQDFGELPALVDVTGVERVEIVRGPASVLYGSDAIGGVVNVVSRTPRLEGVHGLASYRYGDMAGEHRGSARVYGRFGDVDVQLGTTFRSADAYAAPAGTFGDITLDRTTIVQGSGVEDRAIDLRLGYSFSEGRRAFVRLDDYRSSDAGFGYVDPADYAPALPLIDIRYPDQRFRKLSLGYVASGLGSALADRIEVLGYRQTNERELVLGLSQSFGPAAPPGAGLEIENENSTDIGTLGGRLEIRKLASPSVLLTYGLDLVRDDSKGTDLSTVTVVGFGPPQVETSATPQVPDATYRSLGLFVQGEIELSDRASLVVGGRFQDLAAHTRETPGLGMPPETKSDRTVVGAANFIYSITDALSAITSVGKAFRSPNLIEWFFEGPTPEGSGYQIRNPDLVAEQSLNVDLGLRFRRDRLQLEGFVFRNRIEDGIRIEATGQEIQGLPAFRNVNVDRLIFQGVEVNGDVDLGGGFSTAASYTHLDSRDALDSANPVGESFSSKATATFRFEHPGDRFWAEYGVRRQGDRKDVDLVRNPVGDILPAFTVHHVRGGVRLFEGPGAGVHRLGVTVHNLTDVLYAEFSNVSFFRPAPKRHVIISWEMAF